MKISDKSTSIISAPIVVRVKNRSLSIKVAPPVSNTKKERIKFIKIGGIEIF